MPLPYEKTSLGLEIPAYYGGEEDARVMARNLKRIDSALRGSYYVRQPALDMNSGTLVTDWTGGNLVPGGATTIVTPPLSILGPKALRLDANGATSPSLHDIDLSATPITEDAFTALAFVAHNPGTEPQVIRIYVSKTSNYSPSTSFAQTELALWPGTWTYAINREAFKRGDNLSVRFWGTAGDIIRIRIKELDSAANGYYPPSVNSSSLIGSIRMLAPASKGRSCWRPTTGALSTSPSPHGPAASRSWT